MAQDVIVRGVTYTGVEKLSLPVSGGSALFRDTSDADAAAGDVLSGKKAYNANGEINGGMTNQGAVSGTISDKDTPFQIPQGYHNGSGSVEIAAAQKALLVPGNIRDSVTILGVTGDYTGGGGGPTSADALLIVKVQSGSTVTATKGGTTLLPTMWTTAADANFECALFVIGSALFDAQNAWTVTATRGTNSKSNTVIIDSNKEYDLHLFYDYIFYDTGYMDSALACTKLYGSNGTQSLTNQNNALTIYNDYTSGQNALTWFTGIYEKIDVTDYSALELVVQSRTAYSNSRCAIGLFSTGAKYEVMVWTAKLTLPSAAISSETTYTLNISNVSGLFYAGLLNETGASVRSMTMVVKSFKLVKG